MINRKEKIFLKDFVPFNFDVKGVDLEFELFEEYTDVRSVVNLQAKKGCAPDKLVLYGVDLELKQIIVNGEELAKSSYDLTATELTIFSPPQKIRLEIENRIYPHLNTALEGVYVSKGMFCSQCEPEGFRKVTYFPDRPDVMTSYQVKITAERDKYPVLLSNGNFSGKGDLDNGRHWASYTDPFPKPSYLFALVAGDLEVLESSFQTMSGRNVRLAIYTTKDEIDQCDHAMTSLKQSMKWDEEAYGRECDLDDYKIVVASDFNMGAMENKGLNIFNSAYVLADPKATTDGSFNAITEVIGHEYFHNWTGNRVTCRDWFQLCLKEGLTVFREQEFAATLVSPSVQRIDQIGLLKANQFPEDDGPTAHAPRPDHFVEINNFYTATVYEKGAEVVRMIKTLIGENNFRKGMDLYFERHDGQAVTQEDFVQAMADASNTDLTQFMRWYTQSGAPKVSVKERYDSDNKSYTLDFTQTVPKTAEGNIQKEFHVPVLMGLLNKRGEAQDLYLSGSDKKASEIILELTNENQSYTFNNVDEKPVASLFRGLSSPIRLDFDQSIDDLNFLMKYDNDSVNSWEAGQKFFSSVLTNKIEDGSDVNEWDERIAESFKFLLEKDNSDLAYKALTLSLPSYEVVTTKLKTIDPDRANLALKGLVKSLGIKFYDKLLDLYNNLHREEQGIITQEAISRRRLKNTCLKYLLSSKRDEAIKLAEDQYYNSLTMTDSFCALYGLVDVDSPSVPKALTHYFSAWKDNALCLDRWFQIQAMAAQPPNINIIYDLENHAAFNPKNPNRLRSLVFSFCKANYVGFHNVTGEGYKFCRKFVINTDRFNRQLAAGLVRAFSSWRRYDDKRQLLMHKELETILKTEGLSSDVHELTTQIIG